jgi:hypothetical protein
LVTVLKLRGFEPTEMKKVGGGCRWCYDNPPQTLLDIVEEYSNDEAYFEAKELARKLGLVRRDMYQFLGHNPRRIRTA